MTVSMSFELDNGAANGATSPFDNHKVSIASDALGTLTVHGHGGSNAVAALDGTAAGDLWDNSLGLSTTAASGKKPQATSSGDNLVVYTLPTIAEGVAVSASYDSAGENNEGSTAFGATFTGVEGLSVSIGTGETNSTIDVDIEQTVFKASYALGPVTVGYSNIIMITLHQLMIKKLHRTMCLTQCLMQFLSHTVWKTLTTTLIQLKLKLQVSQRVTLQVV